MQNQVISGVECMGITCRKTGESFWRLFLPVSSRSSPSLALRIGPRLHVHHLSARIAITICTIFPIFQTLPYTYICTCIDICTYIYIYICMYICMYVCMYSAYIYIYMFMYMYISCAYKCIYIYTLYIYGMYCPVHMEYIYIYIYTHIRAYSYLNLRIYRIARESFWTNTYVFCTCILATVNS